MQGKRKQNVSWKDFIRAHMAVMVGMDFFTKEVLTLKGLVQLAGLARQVKAESFARTILRKA